MASGNTIFPDPDKLNHMEYGKFVLTNLAARRAKQLRGGAPPLVRIASSHPLSIALAEINEGKIRPILGGQEVIGVDIDEYASLDANLDPEGFLLPSIDDEDAVDVSHLSDLDDSDFETLDSDDEEDEDDDSRSITDLLDDEDEEEDDEVEEEADDVDSTEDELTTDDESMSLDDLQAEEEDEDEDDD
ncbi:MAG: DNA-directed RNA polymerase subunit omega [Fimbriimonadaceae bacterium]|nr:DNA-directed RNA polymerase subunit omega [Fimbriimonadaceae bacterium]